MVSSCSESEGSETGGAGDAAAAGHDRGGDSGRAPVAGGTSGLKKGPWTSAEDAILVEYVKKHGEGNWNAVRRNSGLLRCGKSCRLRWANHLRPNLKKGSFSPEEERLILELHAKLGNKWARMAAQMPGRTDNEIKNYWNTRLKRRQRAGLPIYPPDIQRQSAAAAAAAAAAHNVSAIHPLRPPTPTAAVLPPDASKSHYQFRRHASTCLSPPPSIPVVSFQKYNTISSSMSCSTASAPFLQPRMPDASEGGDRINRLSDQTGGTADTSMLFFTTPDTLLPASSPMLGCLSHNPLPLQHQLHQPHHHHHFSLKMELPSSQMFPPLATDDGGGEVDHWGQNNSSLLEALLGEAPQLTTDDVGTRPGTQELQAVGFHTNQPENAFLSNPSTVDAAATHWGDAHTNSGAGGRGTGHVSLPSEAVSTWGSNAAESNMKAEQMEREMHSGEDDLSALLDILPPGPMMTTPLTWFLDGYDGDVRETSSSGRPDFLGNVDAEIGLEMHQANSSLSTEVDDNNRNSWPDCHCRNMSSIC